MKAPDLSLFAAARAHFEELVELPEEERRRRLEQLSGPEPALARAIAELLDADAVAEHFLDQPVAAVASTLVEEWTRTGEVDRRGTTLGPYRLLEPLGRGGMGEVWLAERGDGQFEQRVALKLLRPGLEGEDFLARFLRERQLLARLTHPGIARLLDGGRAADGRPYFVLERVEGVPITDYCRERGASIEERLRLIAEACDAVEAAHRQLIVHRDLKPSNILVTREGRVQLLDFGIAKLLDEGRGDGSPTRAGLGLLTPAYAAPEHVMGEPVTTATDVFSLGVVLHELLVGVLPHRRSARTAAALAEEVARETSQRPSTAVRQTSGLDERERRRLEKRLRGDLDTIVGQALAREPARRYSSAAALADDLRRYLAGRPVRARPATAAYRATKFVRRHRVGVSAAALAVLSLVAGLSLALWQARRAEANARESAANALRAERTREFLISLFEVADPMQSGGERVSARDLLEQGAKRLESELAGEPALRADLLEAVARLEASLGLLERAERSAELALALRSGAARAPAEATLGAIRIQQGELDEANELLERALAGLRAAGAGPLALARVESDLGQVKFWRKDLAGAEAAERTVVEVYRRELGEEHVETALHLRNLGVILDDLGRLDEAEAAYRRSQAILESHLGSDHPNLGQNHLSLANLLAKRGRNDEAERSFERALAIRRRAIGDRHVQTGQTLQLYAHFLSEVGRLAEAERAAVEALEIFRAANENHFEVGKCLNGLGIIAARRERHADAERWYRAALANFEGSLGRRHPFYWYTAGSLGVSLGALGRMPEAEARHREVLRELAAISGAESEDVRWAHQLLADTLRLAGRTAEADAEAARAKEIAAALARAALSSPPSSTR